MKVIVAFGGLGNVMFYYALATAFRRKGITAYVFLSKTNLEHNNYSLNAIFPNLPIWGNINIFQKFYYLILQKLRSIHYKKYKIPHKFLFYPFEGIYSDKEPVNYLVSVFNNPKNNQYYVGYFQSYKYFDHCRSLILKEFQFSEKHLSEKTKDIARKIKDCNSISVHVRRGDYLNGFYYELLGKVCDMNYYKRATDIVKSKVLDPHFFVFSDDQDFISDNFELGNTDIITFNRGKDSWQDMYLMSICKHNIIANSTFSWWGAWLNNNSKKIVVAPDRWFADKVDDEIIPPEWLRI